jgi:hypothetical protein
VHKKDATYLYGCQNISLMMSNACGMCGSRRASGVGSSGRVRVFALQSDLASDQYLRVFVVVGQHDRIL